MKSYLNEMKKEKLLVGDDAILYPSLAGAR